MDRNIARIRDSLADQITHIKAIGAVLTFQFDKNGERDIQVHINDFEGISIRLSDQNSREIMSNYFISQTSKKLSVLDSNSFQELKRLLNL